MTNLTRPLTLLTLILCGALFGFYYAWVCSTMWGLDAADPRIAIEAMQAMNASVRNAVFAPVFFGTPVALLVLTALLWTTNQRGALPWIGMAALTVILLSLVLTMTVNVPMNEALAQVTPPTDQAAATQIWADYSAPWQLWNQIRTVASAVALLLVGIGLTKLA